MTQGESWEIEDEVGLVGRRGGEEGSLVEARTPEKRVELQVDMVENNYRSNGRGQ